jgi:hypothetical protein
VEHCLLIETYIFFNFISEFIPQPFPFHLPATTVNKVNTMFSLSVNLALEGTFEQEFLSNSVHM